MLTPQILESDKVEAVRSSCDAPTCLDITLVVTRSVLQNSFQVRHFTLYLLSDALRFRSF